MNLKTFVSIDDISDEILSLPKLRSISLYDKDREHTEYHKEEILKETEKRKENPTYAKGNIS